MTSAGRTPEAPIVGASFLILLVPTVIDTGSQDVPSYHFGVVVLPGEQVLSVVPRSKVPDQAGGSAAAAKRLGRTGAVQLTTLREYSRKGSLNGVVQRRCISSKSKIDPVRGPGKCKVVGCGTAKRGGQFCDGHLPGLIPRIAKRGEKLIAPKTPFLVPMQRVVPGILGVAES